MIHEPDERAHHAAIASLLAAAVSPAEIYEHGEVPGLGGNEGDLPKQYVLLQVERMPLPILQASRLSARTSWWVQVRVVDTGVHNCRRLQQLVIGAVENERITLSGHESTPLTFDVADPAASDDGRFSAAVSYTYTL